MLSSLFWFLCSSMQLYASLDGCVPAIKYGFSASPLILQVKKRKQMQANKVWVAKNAKGTFQHEDAETAMVEFGKRYGTRGNVALNECIRENGFLVFKRDCRSFKGTYKAVLTEAMKIDDNEVNASEDKPVTPKAYQDALKYLHSESEGGDISIEGEDGLTGGRNKLSTVMWRTRAKLIEVFTRKNKQDPWKKKDEFTSGLQSRQALVYITNLLKKTPKEVSAEDKDQDIKGQIGTHLQYLEKVRREKLPIRVKLTTGLLEYKKILELCTSVHPDKVTRMVEKSADKLVAYILAEAYIQAKASFSKAKNEKRRAEWEFRMEIIKGYRNGVIKGKIVAKHVEPMSKELRKYFKAGKKIATALADKSSFTHHAQSWKRLLKQNGLEVDNVGIGLVQDMYFKFVKDKLKSGFELPDTGSEERDLRDEFIEEQFGKIKLVTGNAHLSDSNFRRNRLVLAEENTISDRVASIIFGDVKRIRSTIASWKGKMKDNEYKEFVEYQKALAMFIRDHYVSKLPKDYREKITKL